MMKRQEKKQKDFQKTEAKLALQAQIKSAKESKQKRRDK